jgi:UDP-N-acetylmuramyl pentapeptide phosphotransferase/UDP-N-acetylglucosamine-1-phosphate transferase
VLLSSIAYDGLPQNPAFTIQLFIDPLKKGQMMDRSEIKKILIGGLFAILTTVISILLSRGEYNKGVSAIVFLITVILFIIIWPEDITVKTKWYKNKLLLFLFVLIILEITLSAFLLFQHR